MSRYDFFVKKTLFLTSSRSQFFFAGNNCDKNELEVSLSFTVIKLLDINLELSTEKFNKTNSYFA